MSLQSTLETLEGDSERIAESISAAVAGLQEHLAKSVAGTSESLGVLNQGVSVLSRDIGEAVGRAQ
ncbi:hypothetical protein KIPB_012268, partial [Kipferlia bialata]|eukprot:g12268.t1